MGDNGRQGPEKADTPSSTGTHVGETMRHNGRQAETTGNKRRQGFRKADAPSKAETPSNTGTDVGTQFGRQAETRPGQARHTIQHRHTCRVTMGDKRR